jgi:predicted nucleic acid-binding Zn ribbon protein
VLTDIGPIPESEVERLDPLVIDHTVLQKMNEQASNMEEDMKTAAQKDVKVFFFCFRGNCFVVEGFSEGQGKRKCGKEGGQSGRREERGCSQERREKTS